MANIGEPMRRHHVLRRHNLETIHRNPGAPRLIDLMTL